MIRNEAFVGIQASKVCSIAVSEKPSHIIGKMLPDHLQNVHSLAAITGSMLYKYRFDLKTLENGIKGLKLNRPKTQYCFKSNTLTVTQKGRQGSLDSSSWWG